MRFNHVKFTSLIGIFFWVVVACGGGDSSSSGVDSEHPTDYLLEHAVEASNDLASCESCHGTDYAGIDDAISCLDCHADAPPFVVHASAYSDPEQHGFAARINQLECLGCHGTLPNIFDGGVVSDPNLFNNSSANCSRPSCHPGATAHPTNWQGSRDDIDPTYASTHQTVSRATWNESCVLCHKVDGPGAGANTDAPSCYTANHTNSNTILSECHPGGP